jgi:hypothetical protein
MIQDEHHLEHGPGAFAESRKEIAKMTEESEEKKSTEAQLAELRQVVGPPPVLSSESMQRYDEIMAQLMECFAPQGFMQQLLLKDLTDCTWEMARYSRHTTLLMDRRFRQRLVFQAEREEAVGRSKDAPSQEPAEQDRAPLTEPEDAFEGLIEEIDAILLPPELHHFRALEVALVYQEHLARVLNAAAARRDKVLERIERHRASLSQDLRCVSDQIIAAEFALPAAQADEIAAPVCLSSPAMAMISQSKLAARTISHSRIAASMRPQRRLAVRTISQRRIEANRTNGRKSRGPRTAAGKSSASRNALRHGLATITRHNPKHFPDIERMATAICNGDTNPLLFEQALVIAENELVLRCVAAEHIAAIERMRDRTAQPLTRKNNSLARAKARFDAAKLEYAALVRAKAVSMCGSQSKAAQPSIKDKPIKSRHEVDALRQAMPDLDRLARYERRAWSRRKRAIHEFVQIKSTAVNSSAMQTQHTAQVRNF